MKFIKTYEAISRDKFSIYSSYMANIDDDDYLHTLNDITFDLMDYDTFTVDIKREKMFS